MLFDSDAYGVNTDNPPCASEIISNALKAEDEKQIKSTMIEYAMDVASSFFNTDDWGDEEWNAWVDIVREIF